MLLCDRNQEAYDPLGLVDGVHAIMFNSTEEFDARLRYYIRPEAEEERTAIVRAGRELVLSRHLWPHRVARLDALMRDALGKHARLQPQPPDVRRGRGVDAAGTANGHEGRRHPSPRSFSPHRHGGVHGGTPISAAEKRADKLDSKRQQPTPAEAKLEVLEKAHAIGALSDDLYQVARLRLQGA